MTAPAVAAQDKPDDFLQVIPKPRVMTPINVTFPLTREVRIVLANPRSARDHFAARDFMADAKEVANLDLKIGGSGRRSILVAAHRQIPIRKSCRAVCRWRRLRCDRLGLASVFSD
jgi:hypothetical protein